MNILLKNIKQLIGITENSDTIKKAKAYGDVVSTGNKTIKVAAFVIVKYSYL